MNINFSLVSTKNKVSPLRVIITHRGKVYRHSIGISIPVLSWNQSKQKCANVEINKRISQIRFSLEKLLDDTSSEQDILRAFSATFEKKTIKDTTKQEKTQHKPSFWAYFKDYANRPGASQRQRKNICGLIRRTMGDIDNWEDITTAYYFRLLRCLEEMGYSRNYQGSVVSKLRAVMHEGYKLRYHTNLDYIEFRKVANDVDSVYITEEELNRLWELCGLGLQNTKARDLFLIGCYTGARFGDYSQFSKDNIVGDEFWYIQRKTGKRVYLPLSPRVVEILNRYGGTAPQMHQVVFNRAIKDVCRLAGIDQAINIRKSEGRGYSHHTKPKYALVSSHTARRTCCTLLAKKGVPINEIMLISGHTSLQSLQKYLRQSPDDMVRRLKKLDFFQ